MARITIRLSRSAAEKTHDPERLRKAAVAAFEKAGGGDVFCMPFEAGGQRFALSSRMLVEVDWLPNRIPDRPLAEPVRPKRRPGRR